MRKSIAGVAEDKCCGCSACSQVCPKACITMQENERGFLIPVVNTNSCIECEMCIKTCPEISMPQLYQVKDAYAAVVKDKKILKASTSGGLFGIIANYILQESGTVFGCGWGDGLSVLHRSVKRQDDLLLIQQSKYIQSDTRETFIEAKNDIKEGKKVLYSGTACQIAGLRKFLKRDFENLITIEIACHGVPSAGLFHNYINWIEKKSRLRVVKYQFRNKIKHKKGEHHMLCIHFEDGKQEYRHSNEDPYYGSFLQGKTLRKTCYNCKYKQDKRVADILLSDYWGIEKEHPNLNAVYGSSAIVINTQKGLDIWETVKNQVDFEQSTFDKITKHNRSIISCAKCAPEKRLQSIRVYEESLFVELKQPFSLKRRIRNMVPEKVKYLLKRLR